MTTSVSTLRSRASRVDLLEHLHAVGVGQVAIEDHEVGRLALPGRSPASPLDALVTSKPSADSASSTTMRKVFSSSIDQDGRFHAVLRSRRRRLARSRSAAAPESSAPPSARRRRPRGLPPCAST